jgi:hypothetical protein
MRRRLLLVGVVAVSMLALAASPVTVSKPPTLMVPDDIYATRHWGPYDSTTGSLFDAGYEKNSLGVSAYPVSVEGAQALLAAECEARMLRNGVDNATSNIFTLMDDASGRRATRLHVVSAMLDAGSLVSQSASPSGLVFWRPLAGGDAGMPWVRVQNIGVTLGIAPSATSVAPGLFYATVPLGNGAGTQFGIEPVPGYYCVLPVAALPGYGVSHIWTRINRVLESR